MYNIVILNVKGYTPFIVIIKHICFIFKIIIYLNYQKPYNSLIFPTYHSLPLEISLFNLCLLIGEFSLFTFKVNIDK